MTVLMMEAEWIDLYFIYFILVFLFILGLIKQIQSHKIPQKWIEYRAQRSTVDPRYSQTLYWPRSLLPEMHLRPQKQCSPIRRGRSQTRSEGSQLWPQLACCQGRCVSGCSAFLSLLSL